MKKLALLLIPFYLQGCGSVTEDTPGQIYKVSSGSVIIIGEKNHGAEIKPTKRMIEQAQEACPGASYRSAVPSLEDFNLYEYTFVC